LKDNCFGDCRDVTNESKQTVTPVGKFVTETKPAASVTKTTWNMKVEELVMNDEVQLVELQRK
jgi:hypothetical protein